MMLWHADEYDELLRESRMENTALVVTVRSDLQPLCRPLPGRGFIGGNLRESQLTEYETWGLVPVVAPEGVRMACRWMLLGVVVAVLVNVVVAMLPLFGAGWKMPLR